jgi:hypothetical protein
MDHLQNYFSVTKFSLPKRNPKGVGSIFKKSKDFIEFLFFREIIIFLLFYIFFLMMKVSN